MVKYKKIEGFTDEEFNELAHPITRKLINKFFRQSQRSPKTDEQYKSALYIFVKYVYDELDNEPITKLKARDALEYQNYLFELGLSKNAVKVKRYAISSLYNYITAFWSEEYPEAKNIFTKAIQPIGAGNKKEKEVLSRKDIDKLVEHLTEKEDWQKLTYLLFTYFSACRREEARQLKKEVAGYEYFVNPKGDVKNFYMTHPIRAKGKGREGTIRKFQFNHATMIALRKWLEVRGEDDCEFVFVSKIKGEIKQVAPETFNVWCRGFGDIVGKSVHPHMLRRSRATNGVVEEGHDIKHLQKLLGHASSATTEIYVIRDDSNDLDGLFE